MSRRASAILSGVLVTAVILVTALVVSSPDVLTVMLAVAIGASVALSMRARVGGR